MPSPRELPGLPALADLPQQLGFDALRARTVEVLISSRVRPAVEASSLLVAGRRRFVAHDVDEAVQHADRLWRTRITAAFHPLLPSIDGSHPDPAAAVDGAVATYLEAVRVASRPGLGAEVYVGPEQLGVGADLDLAAEALHEVCRQASDEGIDVTLRTGTVAHADAILDLGDRGRAVHPRLGVSVVARRHRSEDDCARLVGAGARVRLVRGGPREQRSVSWADRHEADLAFVRCLSTLLAGGTDLVVATHDPVLLDLADALSSQAGRTFGDVEHQMYLGAQPDLQMRTADAGHRVRVLIPYGPEWFEYLRDLVERPATARRLAEVLVGGG